jgi:hypothetical protein
MHIYLIFSVFILDKKCAKKFNSSQASIAHLNGFTSQSPFNRPAAISHKTEKYVFLRQNLSLLGLQKLYSRVETSQNRTTNHDCKRKKKLKGIRSTFISQWETLTLSKPTLSKTIRMIKEYISGESLWQK